MKRYIDLLLIFISMPIWLPLFSLLIVLSFLYIGRPIFFTQQRTGLNGNPFTLIKFRTLSNLTDSSGALLPDHNRLHPFGSFLRITSLDEIPELFNVLKGEMSLVGPRPLLIEYIPLYNDHQMKRHNLLPGLTGWAQVNGRNAISWEEKFNLDVWYVENQSLWLDMRILWMTIKKVLKREGVSADNHATMPKFTGNAKQDNK